VLKNGHRIVALSAVEDGDKVRYQTAAGELSLPKSIVDHIEKGVGGVSIRSSAPTANLNITPPALKGDEAIIAGAIKGGAVNREFLGKLRNDARSGAPGANENVALAYHAAAQLEASRGDLEHALEDERSALEYAPDQPPILMNVAYLFLRNSQFKDSLDYLDRARRITPNDPDIAKLAGWAYWGLNKPDQAVAEWKRALELRPDDAEVKAALEKAQRDKQEEENYKENESAHFTLRYNGAAQPELARQVLRTLEGHFTDIESALNYSPPNPIGVILYTQQAFQDITQAPGWVAGLNDGRIRIPVQGLTDMTQDLSRVLRHELTHSFIQQKTRANAPTWLQEGVAQWIEGKRSGTTAPILVQLYDAKQITSLGQLEGSWMGLPADSASVAYAWGLANIECIIETDGIGDVQRILDRLATGSSTEAALKDVLRSDYDELMHSTVDYLRKTYIR
jgi:tetratricopeptide (TPR) repeat protein